MADRAVGVADKASAQPGIADYRTREYTVNSLTVCEQYLIRRRERVESALNAYAHQAAVLATADAVSAWRWMVRNPTGSGVTVALRDLSVISLQVTNALANVVAPVFTLERWTATGTASGGTEIAPARVQSGQAPAAKVYVVAPTGVTAAKVATAFSFLPSVNLTTATTAANPRANNVPVLQDYHTNEQGIELAAGEALVFRQSEAGTATEATSRYMLTNLLLEEFTRP